MGLINRTAVMLQSLGVSCVLPEPKSQFNRDQLPTPAEFWKANGVSLPDGTGWKMARCVFHEDAHASLAIHTQTGGFFCHACGAKGGDVLAAHQALHQVDFVTAAKALGAWGKK